MVQVSIEVHAGAARFRVTARAGSIRRAMSLAGARYPGAKVVPTIEPESYFVKDPDEAEFVRHRMPESIAG